MPTELRADLVLERLDAAGVPQLAAIREVQLRPDPDKLEDWPAYLTTYRERRHCETCVVVITPSRECAAWARRPIRLGPGNPAFRVLVLGPDEVPVVADRAAAIACPPSPSSRRWSTATASACRCCAPASRSWRRSTGPTARYTFTSSTRP